MIAVKGIFSDFMPNDPPIYCALPTLTELFAVRASSSIDGIEVTGTRTAATDSDASNTFVADSNTAFQSETAIVQQNWVFDSKVSEAVDLNQPFGVNIQFVDTVAQDVVASVFLALRTQGAINTGNAIIDDLGGFTVDDIKHDDIAVDVGYEIALALNMSDGTVSYKDSSGRSGSLKVSGSFNNANAHLGAVAYLTGTTLNDSIVGSFNQGSQAFGVVIAGAVPHCEV